MRGKADERVLVLLHYGITPAHAGKRSAIARLEAGDWDHPRTCGEKQTTSLDCLPFIGSPPHMRGKGKTVKPKIDKKRITPAHAGKSVYLAPVDTSLSGSPPHMRGKVVELFVLLVHHGITPAHAGKRLKRSRSTVPHAAIVPLFPSVCNKPAGSDGSPAGHDAPPFLPIENTAPASPAYNLRSL